MYVNRDRNLHAYPYVNATLLEPEDAESAPIFADLARAI